MKILYIASNYIPATGGTELSDSTLLNNLAIRKHEITVVTYATEPNEDINNPKIYRISEKDPTNFSMSLCQYNQPDVIYTSLGCSRFAIKIGNKIKL